MRAAAWRVGEEAAHGTASPKNAALRLIFPFNRSPPVAEQSGVVVAGWHYSASKPGCSWCICCARLAKVLWQHGQTPFATRRLILVTCPRAAAARRSAA